MAEHQEATAGPATMSDRVRAEFCKPPLFPDGGSNSRDSDRAAAASLNLSYQGSVNPGRLIYTEFRNQLGTQEHASLVCTADDRRRGDGGAQFRGGHGSGWGDCR